MSRFLRHDFSTSSKYAHPDYKQRAKLIEKLNRVHPKQPTKLYRIVELQAVHLDVSGTDEKWTGMSVKSWLCEFDQFMNEKAAETVQTAVIRAANILLKSNVNLRRSMELAKRVFYGPTTPEQFEVNRWLLEHHEFTAAKKNYPGQLPFDVKIQVSLSGWILDKQDASKGPLWYKGGVTINDKYQHIKFRVEEIR